ncbi:PilN domain-containing protein [Conexibacter sp. SYSU D00693]|uniref:PilN domain-containing protein n=1 Tax=Conexibacter sp. SYSU D00693 TaxID=2812560 RepID=UPI00196AFF7F|nr:hypothetical protein [Conexibacter sp. SYSU D00693]
MKAVNLIPVEARRGGGSAGGHSGGAVYALLGALAVLVVLAGLWVAAGRQADDRRAELADVRAQADAAEARAQALAPFSRFAAVAQSRLQTVQGIAGSRFDWSHTLREVARVIPADVSLEGLDGSVAGSAGAATAGTASASAGGPTLKVTGCTTRNESVARTMAVLRQIDGVASVQLTQSEKQGDRGGPAGATGVAGAAGGGSTTASCRGEAPKFEMTLSFKPVPVDEDAAAAASSTTTAAAITTAGATP